LYVYFYSLFPPISRRDKRGKRDVISHRDNGIRL